MFINAQIRRRHLRFYNIHETLVVYREHIWVNRGHHVTAGGLKRLLEAIKGVVKAPLRILVCDDLLQAFFVWDSALFYNEDGVISRASYPLSPPLVVFIFKEMALFSLELEL